MKTSVLVAFASRFGSTKAIAERIAATIEATGHVVDLRPADQAGVIDGYGAFVIGSSVEAGHWQSAATGFAERNREVLLLRPVWLFSSGPLGDHAADAPQPDPTEVATLRYELAIRDHRVFAGSYDRATADFSGMGLAERVLVRRLMPTGDWRDWPAIEAWAREIADELAAAIG